MANFAVILPAAGKSSRFNDPAYKKPFAVLENRAVWLHSAELFLGRDDVKQLILVLSPDDREFFDMKFGANVAIHGIDVVEGGEQRADSVQNALAVLRDDIEFVAVHDAARPCLSSIWVDEVFAAAEKSGAAILATPVADTLKRVDSNQQIEDTVSRENLWAAQTPQVFSRQLLLQAYAARGDAQPTDEAQLIEQFGQPVIVVHGSPLNIKITTKADLKFAAQCLKALPKPSFDGPVNPFSFD